MPFKSKAQQAYLYANNPKVAKEFSKDMSKEQFNSLPAKLSKKLRSKVVNK